MPSFPNAEMDAFSANFTPTVFSHHQIKVHCIIMVSLSSRRVSAERDQLELAVHVLPGEEVPPPGGRALLLGPLLRVVGLPKGPEEAGGLPTAAGPSPVAGGGL